MATKAVKYRNKVIEELLITEKTYLNNLHNLIALFIEPLAESQNIISNADFHIIFPQDIKTIYNLHQTLFTEFKRDFEHLNSNNDSSKIGTIFCDHAQMFKMYQNYINNHHKAIQKLSYLMKNRKKVRGYFLFL